MPGKYPWEQWLDGAIHTLQPGVDFDQTITQVRAACYMQAGRCGMKLESVVMLDGSLQIRFLGAYTPRTRVTPYNAKIEKQECSLLHDQGWTVRDLADKYGCRPEAVYRYLQGSTNGMPYSSVNVVEAVQLWNEGHDLAALGKRYGVTRERVRQKLKGLVQPRTHGFCRLCQSPIQYKGKVQNAFCEPCLAARRAKNAKHCEACGVVIGQSRTDNVFCQACFHFGRRGFDYDHAAYLYGLGYGANTIAAYLGQKVITIYKGLQKQGLQFRDKRSWRQQKPALPIEKADKYRSES